MITLFVETPCINLESRYLMGRGRDSSKPKSREPNIKMASGMEIDDATTLRSESSFSDSPDVSPVKKNGKRESLLNG